MLRGVDLDVARGSALAIFGSNGAGKTTLLRIIAGIARRHGGNATVLGYEVPGKEELRRRMGIVLHATLMYGDLTAAENLRYYATIYKLDRVDAVSRTALNWVGLDESADAEVRTFSRGMQQRLAIARALLHDPALLLLDEPFSGLDPVAAEAIVEILNTRRRAGTTIVFTTHDFGRAAECATHAAMLHRGRVTWESDGRLPAASELAQIYEAELRR